MAKKDIKEVLSQYVPASVLDQAVEEVTGTEIAPDWFRQQAAELGGAAKERDELKARLESIESAPKRKEALKRVGIDYDAQPRYGQKTLDAIPADKLDDLDFIANFVKEEGFPATVQPQQQQGDRSGAEQIVAFTTDAGTGAPLQTGSDDDFYRELDAVPDGDKVATRAVLEKYGKVQPSEGLATTVVQQQN